MNWDYRLSVVRIPHLECGDLIRNLQALRVQIRSQRKQMNAGPTTVALVVRRQSHETLCLHL